MRTLSLITPPAVEPIGLDSLQEWMPQQAGKDEGKMLGLIASARGELESALQRSLNTQTWELSLDAEEVEDCVWLPRPPLISVTSVKTYDVNNAEATVSSSLYTVEAGDASRVWLNQGQVWLGNLVWGSDFRKQRALVVRYVSGYGAAATDVPEAIRRALKELVTLDYWHPLTGKINPDGAAVDDVKTTREQVFTKVGHYRSAWVAL